MRSPRSSQLRAEVASFAAIGIACTAAYALLYTLLRGAVPDLVANALALLLTMGANFAANRRFTFRATAEPFARQLPAYLAAYLIGLAASSGVLGVLLVLLHHPAGLENTAAALAAGVVATIVRFVLMRGWVFRRAGAPLASAQAEAG
jgi:putative flippase GtrA